MSPSGIVQAKGDPTWVTLRWPAFEGATHYNVRLDDDSTDRIDDPRFETCPDSPHYYCENGVKETFIDGVPVKPGRKYDYWVDPIFSPEREYFNIGTRFEVSSLGRTAGTQGGSGIPSGTETSDIVIGDTLTSGDFVITSLASPVQDNQGPQRTIVIVANVGSIGAPTDIETANRAIFGNQFGSANDYYMKNSYGKVSLTGKVVGPYTLPAETCNLVSITDEAIKAANNDVNFRDYSRIILIVPNTPCFTYGGAGVGKGEINTPDGKIMASISWVSGVSLHIVAHELGHNFGLPHAGSKECFSCESQEYGDRFDVMGTGEMHTNSVYKEVAGWPSNTITATQGEYLLKPLEVPQPAGAVQHIKLPLSNSYYSLEYRQPINYDAGAPPKTYSGVFIRHHIENVNYPATSLINYDQLDKTPLLQVGQIFKGENIEDYEVLLKSIDANGALVQIKPYKKSSFISLTYPKGGEILEIGSAQDIKWESTNIPSDNKLDFIKLRKISLNVQERTLFADIINDGSEPWEIPPIDFENSNREMNSILPGVYKLEILTRHNNERISAISNEFEIVSKTCIDTDGGLDYSKYGNTYAKLKTFPFEDSCVDSPNGGTSKFTGDYVLEFFCREDGDVISEIHLCPNKCVKGRCNPPPNPNAPQFKIISPKKDDNWALGSNQRVEWSWKNYNGETPIKAELFKFNDPFNMELFTDKLSSGYKEIKVPSTLKPGAYELRLVTMDNVGYGIYSELFTISANAPISGRVVEEIKLQNMQELEATLEVLHVDDFENPENSKYIHYVLINGKKYEIKSEEKLPVVLSGSKAKVKGMIIDDKFYLENYINAHPEIISKKSIPKTEVKSKSQGFFNSDWIYILTPTMIILAYLAYLEAMRIKNRF